MTVRFVIAVILTTFTSSTASVRPRIQQAPGRPIYDRSCEQAIADAERLEADLVRQDERIRRTEQQLAAAEGSRAEATAELEGMALKAVRDLAIRQLEAVRTLRRAIEARTPARNENEAATRRRLETLNQWVDRIQQAGEAIETTASRGQLLQRRAELDNALIRNRATVSDFANFLQESGVGDEVGVKLAALAGPAGVLAVETAIVLRDVAFAAAGGYFSAQEAARHRETLGTLKAMRDRVSDFAFQLRAEATRCAAAPRPADRISVTPPSETPSTPPPPAPKAEEKNGGGGGDTLYWLGLGGLVGAAAYYKYGRTCTVPTENTLSVCNSQGGSSEACRTAIAKSNEYCKCEGHSGFNTQSGGCR